MLLGLFCYALQKTAMFAMYLLTEAKSQVKKFLFKNDWPTDIS